MNKYLVLLIICLSSQQISAQQPGTEIESVKKVITQLFDGMRKGDSSMVAATFSQGIVMQTVTGSGTNTKVRTGNPADFLKFVAAPQKDIPDERITFDNVLVDADLATAWTSYKFYLGDKFSHCGVNSFTLVKEAGKWKILHLIDTRRKENCN